MCRAQQSLRRVLMYHARLAPVSFQTGSETTNGGRGQARRVPDYTAKAGRNASLTVFVEN